MYSKICNICPDLEYMSGYLNSSDLFWFKNTGIYLILIWTGSLFLLIIQIWQLKYFFVVIYPQSTCFPYMI